MRCEYLVQDLHKGEKCSEVQELMTLLYCSLLPNKQPQELGIALRGVGVHGSTTKIHVKAAEDGTMKGLPHQQQYWRCNKVLMVLICLQSPSMNGPSEAFSSV